MSCLCEFLECEECRVVTNLIKERVPLGVCCKIIGYLVEFRRYYSSAAVMSYYEGAVYSAWINIKHTKRAAAMFGNTYHPPMTNRDAIEYFANVDADKFFIRMFGKRKRKYPGLDRF